MHRVFTIHPDTLFSTFPQVAFPRKASRHSCVFLRALRCACKRARRLVVGDVMLPRVVNLDTSTEARKSVEWCDAFFLPQLTRWQLWSQFGGCIKTRLRLLMSCIHHPHKCKQRQQTIQRLLFYELHEIRVKLMFSSFITRAVAFQTSSILHHVHLSIYAV